MTRSEGLSARQREILLCVHEEVLARGFPPSVREIAARVGLASPSTVKHHLDVLERCGLLQRVPGLPRALELSEAARAELGVEIGDTVEASIDLDSAEREITVPDDLAAALDADGLRAAFDALAPSRRKEIVRGVTEAKQAATRERRIAAAVDSLG